MARAGSTDGPPPLGRGISVAPGYVVEQHLHRGNDLDVYEIWSEVRDSRCVAKVLRPDRIQSDTARRRLVREGRLLLRLSHPHIVRAYELVQRPETVLILEVLSGATLQRIFEEQGRLRIREIVELGQQLCSALAYLHYQRVLHLDLKPSNIVSQCGVAKLLDLSIARRPGRTRGGIGSRPYMAPEQLRGGCLTEATDVWALGVMLYEAIAGRRPYSVRGGNTAEVPPLLALRRVPPTLSTIVAACLEQDPSSRPTVAAIARALRELAS